MEQHIVSFNPGPSYIDEQTQKDIIAIVESGFLALSHRGEKFSQISKQAIERLRSKMAIPEDYHIFYQPSATAAMETVLINCVKKQSFHFCHGAFSDRFFQTAKALGLAAHSFATPWNQPVIWREAVIPRSVEMIAITHSETSTGLMWPISAIQEVRECYKKALLAIDVTASFGAMVMPWEAADIWLGSVQKCLGLPSGLGFIVISPNAMDQARRLRNKVPAWHRLEAMEKKMKTYQTVETPNMLEIALLARKMKRWNLTQIASQIREKAKLMDSIPHPYIADEKWRSLTIGNFFVKDPLRYHVLAKEQGIILGKGYGSLSTACIRLANFPQTNLKQFKKAINILTTALQ
jgi:phosphoserine aminotransferase